MEICTYTCCVDTRSDPEWKLGMVVGVRFFSSRPRCAHAGFSAALQLRVSLPLLWRGEEGWERLFHHSKFGETLCEHTFYPKSRGLYIYVALCKVAWTLLFRAVGA